MDLNLDDISVIKKTLTVRESRLPPNQQKSTQVNVVIRNVPETHLRNLRNELTTHLNDNDDNSITFRIGSNDHKSISATIGILSSSSEAEYNSRNNISYYGDERALRQRFALSQNLQRQRNSFGGNVGGISDSYCTQFCGRKLVIEEEDENGLLAPVATPYYKWKKECNTQQMRRACGDCPVCDNVDANDMNEDGVEDVKTINWRNLTDPNEREVMKRYLESLN